MNVLKSVNMEKKDIVRAGNAVTGFKDIIGTPVTMVAALVYTKMEEDEKTKVEVEKTVIAIKLSDESFITSISPTVQGSLENILDAYDPEEIKEGLPVIIKSSKSGAGRDFLYMDLQ